MNCERIKAVEGIHLWVRASKEVFSVAGAEEVKVLAEGA